MRPLLLALLLASSAFADPEVIGQVFDSDGKDGGVIDFAILKLKNPDDLDGDPIAVKTDRTGRFSVRLAPGAYRIGDIRKPLERDKRLFETCLTRDLIEIGHDAMYDLGPVRLEKAGTYVTGVVKRAGKGVPGVDVAVFDAGAGSATGVKATTDAAGKYELQMPEVRGPQPLVMTVAEKEGQAFARGSVDLWKPATLDIELPAAYSELMVDLTAPGETWVYFHPKGDPAPYVMHKLKAGAKASIPGFAPGACTLTAICDGAQVDLEVTLPAAAPFAIAIPAGPRHKVDGKAAISGAPADLDRATLAVIAKPSASTSPGYLWSPLARDGSFSFPGLVAGKYEISVAVGKRFESMRWFEVRTSTVAMGVLDLGAPRTLDLSVRAADLLK